MLFSVVIPTFNRATLLRDALDSVQRQTWREFEVIVVDDGSTDETASLLAANPWIRTIRTDNRGPGSARNHGARLAAGEYLAFLDSDDLWFPWTLETYRQVIVATSRPAFIAGRPLRFTDESQLDAADTCKITTQGFDDYLASGDEWRWHGVSSFVIRTDAFRARGGFDERKINGEDADLALKLGDAQGFVQITAPPTFAYREHGGNLTADLDKSLLGMWHGIRSENSAVYPGGPNRSRERRKILTRHVRPLSVACIRRGRYADAARLFCATFLWHVRLCRVKYILGFPLMVMWEFSSHIIGHMVRTATGKAQ